MNGTLVTRRSISKLLKTIGRDCTGRVYLVGETSQVFEGWRPWTDCAHVFSESIGWEAWSSALEECVASGIPVLDEFPGDLVPLPDGFRDRARPASLYGGIDVLHFDPYGAAFRFIARGDEPDYHVVLGYMRHGWIELDRMQEMLDALLPRFSMQTIQQDPAEFRRKYKGLLQMSSRLEPGTVHRPF